MNQESIQIRSDFDALNAAQRNGETVFSEPRVVDAEFPSEYQQYASCRLASSVSCLWLTPIHIVMMHTPLEVNRTTILVSGILGSFSDNSAFCECVVLA